ncbi:MAG: SGNH/GDSL hydrolase family protein [Kiritimatiellae bacterium]|nr:SGNH/GDSL hydrolase family protein [Kiritimatiellia bacterium]
MKRSLLAFTLVPLALFAAPQNKYQLKDAEPGKGIPSPAAVPAEKEIAPGKMLSADGKTVWWDGSLAPLEGKGFKDVKRFYDRMPARLEQDKRVRRGVWSQCYHSSGECFRFKLKGAANFKVRWSLVSAGLAMGHMPATGVSGLDLYLKGKDGKWQFFQNARPNKQEGNVAEFRAYGNEVMLYLPLYNGPGKVEFGLPPSATFEPLGPRANGIVKPVVFYGTSITHGGCCSRPGLSFPALVCRRLDVPLVNLGFSGNGRMEPAMADYLGEVEASCYVLDCLWNMSSVYPTPDDDDLRAANVSNKVQLVTARFEPFARRLRELRPNTPIVFAEQCDVFSSVPAPHDKVVRGVFEKLKAEGWKGLYYVSKDKMYGGDREGTVDGCHPNDWGMFSMADAFTPAVAEALGLKCR